MVLTPEGRVQEVTHPVLFSPHCRLQVRVCPKPVNLFLSLDVISRFLHLNKDLHSNSGLVLNVGRMDILGNIVQIRVTEPQ